MIESLIYINGVYQGQTSGTSWNLDKIFTSDAPLGQGYYLPMPYFTEFTWRVDTYDADTGLITTGEDWVYTTMQQPNEPAQRPTDYDPNQRWGYDPITETYKWLDTDLIIGGGRYNSRLVVVGHRCIYVGEL
jgi:hypothetical protein